MNYSIGLPFDDSIERLKYIVEKSIAKKILTQYLLDINYPFPYETKDVYFKLRRGGELNENYFLSFVSVNGKKGVSYLFFPLPFRFKFQVKNINGYTIINGRIYTNAGVFIFLKFAILLLFINYKNNNIFWSLFNKIGVGLIICELLIMIVNYFYFKKLLNKFWDHFKMNEIHSIFM